MNNVLICYKDQEKRKVTQTSNESFKLSLNQVMVRTFSLNTKNN